MMKQPRKIGDCEMLAVYTNRGKEIAAIYNCLFAYPYFVTGDQVPYRNCNSYAEADNHVRQSFPKAKRS